MKFLLTSLVILVSSVFAQVGSVDLPNGATLAWNLDMDVVTFTMSITNDNTWLGFGPSPDGIMIGTDAAICADDGQGNLVGLDYTLTARNLAGVTVDDMQNIDNAVCTLAAGETSFVWSRPLLAAEPTDASIPAVGPFTFAFAMGSTSTLDQHPNGDARGGVVINVSGTTVAPTTSAPTTAAPTPSPPNTVTLGNGDVLSWVPGPDSAAFTLSSESMDTWLGFGPSPDSNMIGTDAAICADDGSGNLVGLDYTITARSIPGVQPDADQDLTGLGCAAAAGSTVFTWTRAYESPDAADEPILRGEPTIFAFAQGSSSTLGQHLAGDARGILTLDIMAPAASTSSIVSVGLFSVLALILSVAL